METTLQQIPGFARSAEGKPVIGRDAESLYAFGLESWRLSDDDPKLCEKIETIVARLTARARRTCSPRCRD